MANQQVVKAALEVLAARLRFLATSSRSTGSNVSQGGRERTYASLRYGAFLLAYAPLEAFFDDLTGYRSAKNRVLGLSPDRIRAAVTEAHGVSSVTKNWAAHTRVAPTVGTGRRAPWKLLEGEALGA